jgi:hypothetical protein
LLLLLSSLFINGKLKLRNCPSSKHVVSVAMLRHNSSRCHGYSSPAPQKQKQTNKKQRTISKSSSSTLKMTEKVPP